MIQKFIAEIHHQETIWQARLFEIEGENLNEEKVREILEKVYNKTLEGLEDDLWKGDDFKSKEGVIIKCVENDYDYDSSEIIRGKAEYYVESVK